MTHIGDLEPDGVSDTLVGGNGQLNQLFHFALGDPEQPGAIR